MEQNRALVNLLKAKFNVQPLSTVDKILMTETLAENYYMGRFDEVKFGYRQKMDGGSNKGDMDTKGFASDLGGVYGIFRDGTFSCYATVRGKVYHSDRKGEIEEMSGRMLLMKASKPNKSSNLFMTDFQFLDSMKKAEFATIDMSGSIPYMGKQAFDISSELAKCDLCPMRAGCKAPVSMSLGEFGAMVIGEAPGAEEDASGIPFIGRSGKTLWDIFSQSNISRDQLYVSNVLKCRPPSNKIEDPDVAMTCAGRWLQREIKAVHPPLILSLGKTALHFLSGDKKASVMEKNGTVEWSEKWGSWIVWAVHPAMTLYSPGNIDILRLGVEKFIDLFGRMI